LENPAHFFLTGGTYVVSLNVITIYGCIGETTEVVYINSPPVADAGADQTICPNDSVQLLATGGVAYSWSPAATLNDSTVANPLAFPATTTTYTVVATDNGGCTATDSVKITVHIIHPEAGSNVNVCIGSSVQLGASGGVSYQWHPSSFLNNDTV